MTMRVAYAPLAKIVALWRKERLEWGATKNGLAFLDKEREAINLILQADNPYFDPVRFWRSVGGT